MTELVMWPGSAMTEILPLLDRPFVAVPREELLRANETLYGRRVRVKSSAPHADDPYEGVFRHFTVEDEDGTYQGGIFYYEVRLYARELRLETSYGSTAHIPAQNIEWLTVLSAQLERCSGCGKWDRPTSLVHEFGYDETTGRFERMPDRALVHVGCEE